jgi:hypothetical protein
LFSPKVDDIKRNQWIVSPESASSLAGKDRVWYILTGFADCPNCEPEDTQSYYVNFINEQGILIDSTGGAASNGANAYLYDMSP